MLRTFQGLLTALVMSLTPLLAQAHFVWIVAGPTSPDGQVHVYFSEEAAPDKPELLSRVATAKLFQSAAGELTELPLIRATDSLAATPSGTGPKAFFLSHTYGVISRGEETFQLRYYAKSYDKTDPRVWTAVAQPTALPFEITPRMAGDEVQFEVTWQGKPAADIALTIEAEGIDNIEGTTSERGVFSTKLPAGKTISIRAKHTENTAGEQDGKAFASVRHYATLSLVIPAEVVQATLPNLDPPVTSFGAAIAGDYVYVSGGHLGAAHHYSTEGQSARFARLNLKTPTAWENLADVPKRTGLAMVPYQGKVIRIGGFEARNKEGDKEELVSMADVASYDPATNTWTELTSLPQGRSSHDAVVIGDSLYVVGGWYMNREAETVWHDNALVADLKQQPIVWQPVPQPFHRRAVSAAEWHGQLVVLGGMQEKGGPTKITAFYNPQTKTWTDGPELQGNNMDGFGSSAFAIGDTLYVSTMSGKLQRLSQDGKRFDSIAQLQHPRFFHRMLPTAQGQLLFVGGASMQTGKVAELELFNPTELLTAEK
ncbi:hypothetical protein GC163_19550 [bacterium]|nr:hypothetical protein [bacterium]